MHYLPMVKSFKVVKIIRFGDTHTALVGTDCEYDGTIEYIHVLILMGNNDTNTPIFATAVETSVHFREDLENDPQSRQ